VSCEPAGSSAPGGGYGGYGGWSAAGSPYGSQPNSQALAAAQALLASNPSLLTQAQFNMLQAAGLISSSLPYSSVSSIAPTAGTSVSNAASGIDPATGVSYAQELAAAEAGGTSSTGIGADLSQTYAGLPLYLWLLIGGGAVYMLTKGRR
jgi:hypothetical protein